MSKDIHKWSDGRYTLMFDEHTFFVWDNEKDERMTALETTERLNEQQSIINELGETNEILLDNLNKELNHNHQSSQSFINERTKDKDEIIEELKEEDKRLNQVIINLNDDMQRCKQKIKMQDHIIDTQQDIINAFCELVGMINDKE